MNREVIEFCIEQLERISTIEGLIFNMNIWANMTKTHPFEQPEDIDCGFAGCFLGWAAHQQWFDQFGLPLRLHLGDNNPNVALRAEGSDGRVLFHSAAIQAVENLLGISTRALEFIILPDEYPTSDGVTTDMVLARLRHLLRVGDDQFVDECTDEMDAFNNNDDC